MDFSQPFSSLNERLRPRFTTSEKLYSSLSRLEDRQSASLRYLPTYYRSTILPAQPEPIFSPPTIEPEDPEELKEDAGQGDLISDDSNFSELSLKDVDDEEPGEDGESSASVVEEKDIGGELTSEDTGDSSQTAARVGESSLQRHYLDGTLPDLVRSGRPLGRRRTLGHDTLQEVRREVELSRKRSIKIKAQVDKLQENRDGLGWSKHRETVTEEVQSILRLLQPLTKPESGPPQPPPGRNKLDSALTQLQIVARKLAINHTTQFRSGNCSDEGAILQQALCDRDDAIEKKKAMEAELLRSKTEMMLLNNQLLEAVQKRLEVSLELEAWKEDVQLILQHQVQIQQQAEQAQKKSSRMGILRRHNKPPIQRPPSMSTPVSPVTNASQIFIAKSASSTASTPIPPSSTGTQRNWRDKLKRGKTSRSGEQDAGEQVSELGNRDDDFQVVSLD